MFQHLLDCPVLALRVTSFLSGRDIFRLQCVSRCLREFVLDNDEPLFRAALKADFPEGRLLVEAFSRDTKASTSSAWPFDRLRANGGCERTFTITPNGPIADTTLHRPSVTADRATPTRAA